MVIMWNKISLRLKITIITAVALFLVTVYITWFANYNVLHNVITPLENIDDERFYPEQSVIPNFAREQRVLVY